MDPLDVHVGEFKCFDLQSSGYQIVITCFGTYSMMTPLPSTRAVLPGFRRSVAMTQPFDLGEVRDKDLSAHP